MRPKVAAGAEHLPAVKAPVGPLLVVHGQLVDTDAAAGGEGPATGGAGEGPLAAVPPQVGAQVAPSGKAAAADAAGKGAAAACCRSLPQLAALTCGSVFFTCWRSGVLLGLRICRDGDHREDSLRRRHKAGCFRSYRPPAGSSALVSLLLPAPAHAPGSPSAASSALAEEPQ